MADIKAMITEVNLIITLLNEIRTDHNAHVHTGCTTSTASTGVTDRAITATAIAGAGKIYTVLGEGAMGVKESLDALAHRIVACIELANDLRAKHLSHVHDGVTAGGASSGTPNATVTSSDAPAWSAETLYTMSGEPALRDPVMLSSKIASLVTLVNELKTDHNAHKHTGITAGGDSSNDPTDVGKTALAAIPSL